MLLTPFPCLSFKSNFHQNISLGGIVVVALLRGQIHCFYLQRIEQPFSHKWGKTSASPALPTPLPSVPWIQQRRRCFMSCLESKVITYHQSKLIIVDWVGVVNDYRGGRSKAVSHTASSQCGLRERGGSTHLFGIHWETMILIFV